MITQQTDEVVFQEEKHTYTFKGERLTSVTNHIKAAGFGPDFSRADPRKLAHAQRRGNMVDLALVYHYEGDLAPGSVDPAIQGYFDGALKFDRECPGGIVAIHPRLVSTELKVAGTPDIIRFIRGRRAVVDWKTGIDNPLQTCLYLILWNLRNPYQVCSERYGLKLNADGTYKLKKHENPDDVSVCMAILSGQENQIAPWRKKYGKAL